MLLNYIRKKKKRKEIQKHTDRNTLHINSSTGDFVKNTEGNTVYFIYWARSVDCFVF